MRGVADEVAPTLGEAVGQGNLIGDVLDPLDLQVQPLAPAASSTRREPPPPRCLEAASASKSHVEPNTHRSGIPTGRKERFAV